MAAVAVLSSRCGACGQRNEWRVPLAMADRCVADARSGSAPPRACRACRGRIRPTRSGRTGNGAATQRRLRPLVPDGPGIPPPA